MIVSADEDRARATDQPLRLVLSGVAASLVGIGLARFAYTPLIPVLIERGWFSSKDAFYLGAANLAGYLAGALLAPRLVGRLGAPWSLRAMMVAATLSFIACAEPAPFWWFFLARFSAGFSGGALMAVAAPSILPHVPAERRGRASGIIFTGVGLGIALSGIAISSLVAIGLTAAWLALALASCIATLGTWNGWPRPVTMPGITVQPLSEPRGRIGARSLQCLYLQYGLNAVGLVPHMVFLVDFVTRGAARGLEAGALAWVIFGLGALAGPFTLGSLADRIGIPTTLRLGFAVQALAVSALALTSTGPVVLASAFIAGAYTPGIVPLVLGRVREILAAEPARVQPAWSAATASFALMQALGAYAYSYLFAATGNYRLLFTLGAACLVAALAIDLIGVLKRATVERNDGTALRRQR